MANSFLAPKNNSIFSVSKPPKKEIITPEELEKFEQQICQAKSNVIFPDNP
jgi:hypothetical protein